ncbi:MAG: hypothetical protein ACRDQA_01850 [Nocardioidaceae bacterium]
MARRAHRLAETATSAVDAATHRIERASSASYADPPPSPPRFGEPFIRSNDGWQSQAWRFLESVPELSNAVRFIKYGVSRTRLYVAELTETGEIGEPTDDARVRRIVEPLLAPSRQPGFLSAAVPKLVVAGDMWLTQGDDGWHVVSDDSVQPRNDGFFLTYEEEGRKREKLLTRRADGTLSSPLMRIWEPDARYPWLASSPVKALLPVLQGLVYLDRLISSVGKSRLMSAGMLLLSDKIEAPPVDPAHQYTKSGFVNELMRVASQAIASPQSAEAWVPVIAQGDLSDTKVAEHITWDTDFPELLVKVTELLLQRLAYGMPLPPEITLSTENQSHWGMWFSQENAVRMSLLPVAELLASALTNNWLTPMLRANGIDSDKYTIAVDVSAMVLRPDKSSIAIQLFDRVDPVTGSPVISSEALRRETGFTADDAGEEVRTPDGDPGRGNPDGTRGPDSGQGDKSPHQSMPRGDTRDTEPGPPLGGVPTKAPTQAGLDTRTRVDLDAVASMAMTAALNRLGSKLRTANAANRKRFAEVPSHQIHITCSVDERSRCAETDMWPDGVLEQFASLAGEQGYDPECAKRALREHGASCARTGTAHDESLLRLRMRRCVL